jgi:phage gpG-like protein
MTSVTITVYGKELIAAKYGRMAGKVAEEVTVAMQDQMTQLADYVRSNKLSGDPLHRRTGKLSRSITGDATLSGRYIIGRIGSKGVPYAHVHEMGGTFDIPAHTRRIGYNAREQRVRLLNRNNSVRAAVRSTGEVMVRAHTATYPQRAFLHPSMQENQDKIITALRTAVVEAIHDA